MRTRIAARVLIASAAFGAASPLAAQSARDSARNDTARAPRALDAVVVTASRRLQRTSDAPVTTEVISRADVERSGAQDLHALLTQYVGVQPEPGVSGTGGVQIEGLSSQHVMLLVDGQPVVGRIDGEMDLSRVPAWMIERVEVIKGPLSTLYGSSAMGGVINVITRDAFLGRPAMIASMAGGTGGRLEADGGIRGGTGDLRGVAGLGLRQDDVQPSRSDQSGARANRSDVNARVRWARPHSGLSIEGAALGEMENQRWQSGQLFFFSDNSQANLRATLTAPIGDIANRAGLTVYYSRFGHLSRQATVPEPVSDSGSQSTESLARIEATYSGMAPRGTVDAGVAIDREALATDRVLGGHRASSSVEPYAQYTIDAGRFSVVPGVRLSASDQWGTHFTPKIAAVYRLGDGVVLRASTGAGYRAPDFKELYITFLNSAVGYVVHGNPALRPETSTNLTGGIEWTGRRAYGRVQAYSNRFGNFIESVQAPDSGNVQQFTYGNVAHGMTRGVDLDAGVTLGTVSVDGSYGWLTTADRATGLPLLGATPRSARLTVQLDGPGGIRPSVTGLYWSATPSAIVSIGGSNTTVSRGAFTRVDARIARRIITGVDANIGVSNLFGATPVDWPGETARRWYVGMSVDRRL